MAARLLTQLRHHFTTANRHRFLSPQLLRPISSAGLLFRRSSDVAQPLPKDLTTSKETLSPALSEPKISVNGAKDSVKSSLNEAELAKFSAIAET
uniref:Uncharacterized protein n=2 Tax=Chenopodium quinoa TaxID=63459 RepID=A0A803M6D4_CHEQI